MAKQVLHTNHAEAFEREARRVRQAIARDGGGTRCERAWREREAKSCWRCDDCGNLLGGPPWVLKPSEECCSGRYHPANQPARELMQAASLEALVDQAEDLALEARLAMWHFGAARRKLVYLIRVGVSHIDRLVTDAEIGPAERPTVDEIMTLKGLRT